MVEILLEACGQEVAVAEHTYNLESSVDATCEDDLPADIDNLTPIQKFYNGQSVFITGGTGFLGKLLIEKILRECSGIAFLYLLIRPKKGKDVHQRIEELVDDSLFERLKEEQPKFRHQLVAIAGDCSQPGLGMSATDRALIQREVSIVFHVAATVRFDEKLKRAVAINVRSLKDAISICKEMPGLKSFVHVSTAYANCPYSTIEEKFYESPMDADKLMAIIDCMDEKLVDDITPRLLGVWPNTYAYTKAVAENVVKKEGNQLPIGVFRPSIVISTYTEPIRGWVDNMYGPTGVAAGAGTGLLRSMHCDGSVDANIVPGDYTVNAMIACAWDIANRHAKSTSEAKQPKEEMDSPIYNFVGKDNPLTFDQLKVMSAKHGLEVPTIRAIWYYSFRNNKHKAVHLFYVYFLHLLPALIIDTFTLCLGKQPRLLKLYKKIHRFMEVLNYFCTQNWEFSNDKLRSVLDNLTVEDREKFQFDLRVIDWDYFFQTYIKGIRIYLIKDPIETLPQARVKWQRLYWLHQITKLVFAYCLLRILWAVMSSLFPLLNHTSS